MPSKLQPKDIARYVANEAIIQINNFKCDYVGIEYGVSNGYYMIDGQPYITYFGGSTGKSEDNAKLCLFSPNLTTPITIKGKTITPLLEMAKIVEPVLKWKCVRDRAISGICSLEFEDGCFIHRFKDELYHIPNQSALFDWLDEHFIDYRGLIENGLAVDVTTLKENPYK